MLSSIALGFIGIALGIAVFRLEAIESSRGEIAAWLLIGFGLAYFVWGAAAAAPPPQLTEGQRFVMDGFGAKRFRTVIQRDAVAEAEAIYGLDKLKEYTKWAATKGFTLGDAVSKMDLTLKKWGKPKPTRPVAGESEIDRLYREEQEALNA